MDPIDWLGLALIITGGLLSLSGAGVVIGLPLIGVGAAIVILSQLAEGVIGIAWLVNRRRSKKKNAKRRRSVSSGGSPSPYQQQSQTTQAPQGATPQTEPIASGRDHDTVGAGEYLHYEFSVDQPVMLDYTVESLNEAPFNAILTTADEFDRFTYREDIRLLQRGSDFESTAVDIQTRLDPADYVIIIDNTGREHKSIGNRPLEIEVMYELRPAQ